MPWSSETESEQRGGTSFVHVANPGDLQALFATPSREPVVLFIHDRFCATSAAAYREMSALGGVVHLILTGDQQHLSARVENYTGIRHESPQVIILWNGKALWSAAHYQIRREDVLHAIESVGAGSG